MSEELTDKQKNILIKIQDYFEEYGYSPSIRDICSMTGLKSTATVFDYLNRIKEKGYIDYCKGKFRTIVILKRVDE